MPIANPFRVLKAVRRLVGGLLAAALAVAAAQAQPAADAEVIDPPGRVGSVTLLAGPVTLTDLATGSREEALLNWPVTGGWRIDAGRAARAEVRIGSTVLRLDEETTVDFVRIDDHFMQLAVLRGAVALRVRNPEVLTELEVLTQRERIVFEQTGSFRIDVDRTPGLTAVTVFAGRAQVATTSGTVVIGAGQRGELAAAPNFRFQVVAATADRFDDWVAARDRREEAIRSASYVSRETTGVELLDDYGDWRVVPDYGAVWFPRGLAPTWAPYRYGRWVWISPWGWTWIDEAPWGFAPLHYGRWVVVGGVWAWVPGVIVPRPVYAPALVAWYARPGVTITVGAPIGWFPLGPREPYVPPFRHSPRFLRVVNVQHVPDVERVTIVQTPRYVHRHPERSTWVPPDRFGRPEPVERGQRPPPSEWRQFIARPQPPANVPNTKRRQDVGERPPQAPPVIVPGAASDRGTPVRPPQFVPRGADAPRPPEAPRAGEPPRGIDAPRPPEVPRPVEAPRGIEAPRAFETTRSIEPPRSIEPLRSIETPRQIETPPRLIETPPPADAPRVRPSPPAFQPRLPQAGVDAPAAPPASTAPRAAEPWRDRGDRPARPVPTPPGRGDLPPGAPEQRRMSPRTPMPSAPASPAFSAPQVPVPSAVEVPAARGRGDGSAPALEFRRPSPGAVDGSAPPAPPPMPRAAPAVPPPGARDSGAPPSPPRESSGERDAPRPGRSPGLEAAR